VCSFKNWYQVPRASQNNLHFGPSIGNEYQEAITVIKPVLGASSIKDQVLVSRVNESLINNNQQGTSADILCREESEFASIID
jgi:hypothetical protein